MALALLAAVAATPTNASHLLDAAGPAPAQYFVEHLSVEHLEPDVGGVLMGIDVPQPRFSWRLGKRARPHAIHAAAWWTLACVLLVLRSRLARSNITTAFPRARAFSPVTDPLPAQLTTVPPPSSPPPPLASCPATRHSADLVRRPRRGAGRVPGRADCEQGRLRRLGHRPGGVQRDPAPRLRGARPARQRHPLHLGGRELGHQRRAGERDGGVPDGAVHAVGLAKRQLDHPRVRPQPAAESDAPPPVDPGASSRRRHGPRSK